MNIILVVATSLNNVIGKDNKLPWYFPEDLKKFKEITSGGSILMGKNTFFSIGKPLPNRRNIVLTSSNLDQEGVEVYSSMEDFFDKGLAKNENIYVIGGESIYRQFLDKADYIYLSLIKYNYDGDTFFPEFENNFKEIKREDNGNFDFIVYQRK